MKFRTLIPSLFLSLAATFSSLNGGVLLELNFPYASKWTNPTNAGLGNGMVDFDLDGQKDDAARGLKCSTPTDPEYLGTAGFTNPGPELFMRGVLAHLDSADGVPPNRLSSHGITKSSIRLEGTRKTADMSSNMGYVGWWYIPSASFKNGGSLASFANGGRIEAASSGNRLGIVWRVLVKNGDEYFISDAGSDAKVLAIQDVASANWVLYRHAEAGLGMRLKVDSDAVKAGRELTQIEGIGIYAELIGFDGTALGDKPAERVLLDVTKLTVTLP